MEFDQHGLKGDNPDMSQASMPLSSASVAAQFNDVLQEAAKKYSDATNTSLQDFTSVRIASVADLTAQIDAQNEHFAKFRARRQALFHGINAALRPVEMLGDIISGAAGEVFPASGSIYSAVMFLVKAAHDVSSIYDAITELFEHLADFTGRLEVYLRAVMSSALRQKVVEVLSTLFEVIVLSTKEVQRGRFRAYFKSLVGSRSPIQASLEKLKALTLSEERQVITDSYGLTNQIHWKQNQMANVVNQVSEDVQGLRLEQKERASLANSDRLRELLQPSPYPEDYFTSFSRMAVEGTGNWILQDEAFGAWLKGETRFLWMTGGLGTGKSFLATRLIAWGLEQLPHMSYFYFRDADPESRSTLQAMRDVAYQLSEGDPVYARQLLSVLHNVDEIRTVSSAYRKLFRQPFLSDGRGKLFYTIFDGIDEADAEEMDELLAQMGQDTGSGSPRKSRVQVAVVGKSYLDSKVNWTLPGILTIQINTDKTFPDVRTYIVDQVTRSRVLSQTTTDFKHQVIEALEDKAAGVFIMAKFMMEAINTRRHPRSILESLQTYPQGVQNMLQRTADNLASSISEEELSDLNEILRWVSCSEESLTLEHLEVVLTLRFGDPPMRLEEALRGQYACFFELERADGLSTDDLIKEFERQRRQLRDASPASGRGSSRHRRLSSSSPRQASPHILLSHSTQSSPKQTGGGAQFSPKQSSPLLRQSSPTLAVGGMSPSRSWIDESPELEFRSNKSSTYVSFFHTSIRQFFRDAEVLGKVGFQVAETKRHVAHTCLRIFTDTAWFRSLHLGHGREAIRQYAARYWQKHVSDLEAADPEIGVMVHQMLTDQDTIVTWCMRYEKTDEGLKVLSGVPGLQRWLADPRFVESLDEQGKRWATQASKSLYDLCKPVGKIFAAAWLSSDFAMYIPTLFCFKVVLSVANLEAGVESPNSSFSDDAVSENITRALRWADYAEDAHWHRRVGSTYLTLKQHNNALYHYYKAVDLDNNSVKTSGRIAYCLTMDKRYEEALDKALECAALEEADLRDNVHQGAARDHSRWRLYKDHLLIAICYWHVRQLEDSFLYFRKAIDQERGAKLDPQESFEPWTSYLQVLAAENQHAEMMRLVEELAAQTPRHRHSKNRLGDLLLDESSQLLVLEWLPRAAKKTDRVAFFLDSLDAAIDAAQARRDPITVLHLRLAMAATLTYDHQIYDSMAMYEQISFLEFRPRSNVRTRLGHSLGFQKVAALYRRKVLDAGLMTAEGQDWLRKLEEVQRKQAGHQNVDMPSSLLGSDVNSASIYLASFYRLLGRQRDANVLLKALIMDCLDILSDREPDNDKFALDSLVRLFIAADDVVNAKALAQSMRKVSPQATLMTPRDSPVHLRKLTPKLPDITSSRSCGQCLDNVAPDESFCICKLCLDFFCERCLETVIKKADDNDEGVICKKDHAWVMVPPLNRILHRGEVWFEDSITVVSFNEWKWALEKNWDAISPRVERRWTMDVDDGSSSRDIPFTSQDSALSFAS